MLYKTCNTLYIIFLLLKYKFLNAFTVSKRKCNQIAITVLGKILQKLDIFCQVMDERYEQVIKFSRSKFKETSCECPFHTHVRDTRASLAGTIPNVTIL